jgi:hypothetical protein
MSGIFGMYGAVAEDCLGRHADVVRRMGLEMDDIRELRDTLWALEDAYREEDDDAMGDEILGEDEEY